MEMEKPCIDKLFTGGVKQLGNPNAENKLEQPWKSGIFKKETEKAVFLSKTGFTGDDVEIGRASCRERVWVWGGAVAVKEIEGEMERVGARQEEMAIVS